MFATQDGQDRAAELDTAASVLRGCTEALDIGALTATDAAALVAKALEVQRLAAGARMLLAAKAAEAGTWRAKGHRSPEDWLAQEAGTSIGQAKGDLEASKKLSQCPKTERAVREGKVSPEQAREITDAAAADPSAEGDLLGLAEKGAAHKELRDESRRRKAAADPDPEATSRRIHRERRIRTGTDPDSTWWMQVRGPSAAGAGIMAVLRRQADRIFQANRCAGIRENPEVYLFDALVQLLTGTTQTEPATTSTGSPTANVSPTADAPAGRPAAPAPAHGAAAGAAAEPPTSGAASPAPDSSAPATPHPGAAPATASPGHTVQGRETPGGAEPGSPSPAGSVSGGTAPPARAGDPAPPPGPGSPGTGPPAGTGPPGAHEPSAAAPTLSGLETTPTLPVPRAVLPTGANAKIIVRIDHSALVRGYPVPGEVCEVEGIGTVDVASVRDWMTDAFLAAVLTDGTDITRVVHLGRKATALQTTALQADGIRCQRLGCGRTEGLQLDHREEWSKTHHTRLGELDWLCRYDHSLKTLYGWTLEPGTGPRRMHPPDERPGHTAA
jgi:hypothetical protein